MISSSKSKSTSNAWDNRSMAEGQGVAAGGNSGIVTGYYSGDKIFGGGKTNINWKVMAIAGTVAFGLWKLPVTRKLIQRVFK